MNPKKTLNNKKASPTEMWAQLDPELRAQAICILAQMAHKFIVAQAQKSTGNNESPGTIQRETDGED